MVFPDKLQWFSHYFLGIIDKEIIDILALEYDNKKTQRLLSFYKFSAPIYAGAPALSRRLL